MPTRRLVIAVLSTSTVLSLLTCAGGTAWAANRYVNAATDSDASNDCLTQASPCKTIGHAIDQAAAGDTVTVGVGTYAGPVTVDKTLTLRGARGGAYGCDVTRTGLPATESVVTGGLVVTANGVTIDGFTIQGDNSAGSGDAGITLGVGTSGARVTGNIVQDHDAGLRLRNDAAGNAAVSIATSSFTTLAESSPWARITRPSRGTASSEASSPSVSLVPMSNRTST